MSNVKTKKEGKWTEEQEKRLICCQCHWPLWPPAQLGCCGARLCADCISLTKSPDFKCWDCLAPSPNVTLDKGFRREMKDQVVICPLRDDSWNGPFQDLRAHLETHSTLECKNCKQKFVFSAQLAAHQRDKCKVQIFPCPLASVGCSHEVLRSELGKHCLDVTHQQCLVAAVKEILNKRSQSMTRKIINEDHQRLFNACHRRVESELELIDSADQQYAELNSKRQMMDAKSIEIGEKLKRLSEDIAKTVECTQSLYQVLSDMEKQINEINSKPITGPNLLDNDDTYLWKTNRSNFLNDNSFPIYSDLFQTSEWGYKLGAGMDVQVNEKSKTSFILVSFIIFRGDYDSILQWPFPYPVTLCLMNLKEKRKNVIYTIRPNSQTAIFGRPVDTANEPYRISDFCPVEKLLENGNEDIFIKMHIDFSETGVHPFGVT